MASGHVIYCSYMTLLPTPVALWGWLQSILQRLSQQDLHQALERILEIWNVLGQLRTRFRYHGLYEILEYDATLEILDSKGKKAILTRREVIRFLQDNVVAIHDHAWGDGRLFAEYRCQPGVPVDFYENGSKYNVLISLRETENRGDVLELWIERVIRNGLLQKQEWFETEIDHLTRSLKLAIIFPKGRPCRKATLSRRSTSKTTLLSQKHFALLPNGRQKLTWETRRPKLHDRYTIKWAW